MKLLRTSIVLRAVAVVALSLVVGHSLVRGQRGRRNRIPAASKVLESLKTLTCSFPAAASAIWQGSEPQAQARKLAAAAVLAVYDIDTQDGSAEMTGGALRSATRVTVKLAGSTLHFLDIGLDGAAGLLTVFARESHDGRLQAVFSRVSYSENGFGAPEAPIMSQYYGDCEVGSRQDK
jgi:hypothetical protein